MMKHAELAILPLAALMVAGLVYYSRMHPHTGPVSAQVPDFKAITDISTRKKRFIAFMLPRVRRANASIRKEREDVLGLQQKVSHGHALSPADAEHLSHLLSRYKVDAGESRVRAIKQLLTRVDTVPASLILAQSASESAWGTSRFARKGNNFFGIWCFTPGCGMPPKYRDEGLSHEVEKFDSVQQSVNFYLHTINTNIAYRGLRIIRARLRHAHRPVRGMELVEGLRRYSERRDGYVRDIRTIIRINKLQQFTQSLQVSDSE